MEYIGRFRDYAAGFRVPDFSRLWKGAEEAKEDDTDGGGRIIASTLIEFERYLVRYQELALWTDPKSSLAALAIAHMGLAYLAATSNTGVNLAVWGVIVWFAATTWTRRIWPEIRVPEAEAAARDEPLAVPPGIYSASEVADLFERAREKLDDVLRRVVTMRRERPGRFCLVFAAAFSLLAYVGAFVSALGLLYFTVVGSLVVAPLFKMLVNHPSLRSHLGFLQRVQDEDKKRGEDAVDGAEQTTGILENARSTLHSGISALSSNLPDLTQIQKDLRKEVDEKRCLVAHDDEEEEEQLKSYLPPEDESNSQILENLVDRSDHWRVADGPQERDGDEGAEYNSLIEGIDYDMPGHDDEVEQASSLPPANSIRGSHLAAPASGTKVVEEDDFLPSSSSGSLLLSETVDEDEVRLLYQVQKSPDLCAEEMSERTSNSSSHEDDFELVSADDLNLKSSTA